MTTPALPLLLVIALGGEVGGEATLEGRTGRAPMDPARRDRVDNAAAAVLTPAAWLMLAGGGNDLHVRYAPALNWMRVEGGNARNTPSVLHSAGLTARFHPAPTVALGLSAGATTGEADTTALARVLDRRQAQIPAVADVTSLQASATATITAAGRWQYTTVVELAHLESARPAPATTLDGSGFFPDCPPPPPLPLAQEDPPAQLPAPIPPPPEDGPLPPVPPGPAALPPPAPVRRVAFALPAETSFAIGEGVARFLTKRDQVRLRTRLEYRHVAMGASLAHASSLLGWQHRLGPRDSVHAGLGLGVSRLITSARLGCAEAGRDASTGRAHQPGWGASPMADVGATLRLHTSRQLIVDATFSGGLAWYFDPVVGTSRDVAATGFALSAQLPPDWTLRLDASLSTSLRSPHLIGNPDVTLFSAALPLRRRLGPAAHLELGVRWADRGPALAASDFHFRQRELWIYAAVDGSFSSAWGL